MKANPDPNQTMNVREASALQVLVKRKEILQAQADGFRSAHNKLAASGLIP